MIYIGVDPGKKGGFAIITHGITGKQLVEVFPWDDKEFIHQMRALAEDDYAREVGVIAAVEKVASMPHDSHKAAFNFGHSLGFIEGVLSGCWIGYQLVPPNVWKKSFSLIGKDKQASIEVCRNLFPDVDLKRTERCRTESDGKAEALLLCTYAMRHFGTGGAK